MYLFATQSQLERFNPWWKNEEDSAIEEWKNATVKWFPAEILNLSLKPFSLNFLSGQDRWERQLLLNFL
jgi:hypothetical protein